MQVLTLARDMDKLPQEEKRKLKTMCLSKWHLELKKAEKKSEIRDTAHITTAFFDLAGEYKEFKGMQHLVEDYAQDIESVFKECYLIANNVQCMTSSITF